jgi:cyclase
VRKKMFGKRQVYVRSGTQNLEQEPGAYCQLMQQFGAGELFVQSIDLEGSRTGYDLPLMQEISAAVEIPVVACGGAGSLEDIRDVLHSSSVAAAAAGTMFVLHGRHKAPLISYPRPDEIAGLRRPAGDPP